MSILERIDQITVERFGVTRSSAVDQGICVQCKEEAHPNCYSEAGLQEYRNVGLCQKCFNEIMDGIHNVRS